MRLTKGSVVSFTPDPGWTAHFVDADGTWTLPVIGWAVVVRWAGHDGDDRESDSDMHETDVTAVLLIEGSYPCPLTDYHHHADFAVDKVEVRRDSGDNDS